MAGESRGVFGFKIKFSRQVTAVLQKLNTCQCRAKPDSIRTPITSGAQSCAQPAHRMPAKSEARHPRKPPAFPQDQTRMEMTNDCLLDLRRASADGLVGQKEGQGGGVMA